MSDKGLLDRLQALLSRIQRRAVEPRPTKIHVAHVLEKGEADDRITLDPVRDDELMVIEPIAASVQQQQPPPPPPPVEATETRESKLEEGTVSGEYEVAGPAALELEELGPADELDADETVIEINVDGPEPVVTTTRSSKPASAHRPEATDELAAHVESGRSKVAAKAEGDQAPVSGRELVSAPHESARLPVAAPATPIADETLEAQLAERPAVQAGADPSLETTLEAAPPNNAFEPVTTSQAMRVAAPIPEAIEETPPAPPPLSSHPRSSRPQSPPPPPPDALPDIEPIAASMSSPPPSPSAMSPRHTDVSMLAPLEVAPHPPTEPPPQLPHVVISEAPSAGGPEPVAVSVVLNAGGANTTAALMPVTVALEAVVVRPGITPGEVAAIITAARTFSPEDFGVLLDAALDL